MRLFCLLYWISTACIAQVNSVEILTMPGFQTSNGFDWPSFSEQSKRLCFAKKDNEVTIMVAELLASGSWSQPYVAFTLSKKDLLEGLSFSSSGNRIYIGLNNDVYLIDYLGGTSWSIPLKIGPPVSTKEYGEHQPSILENDQELCFLRGVKTAVAEIG